MTLEIVKIMQQAQNSYEASPAYFSPLFEAIFMKEELHCSLVARHDTIRVALTFNEDVSGVATYTANCLKFKSWSKQVSHSLFNC